MDGAITVFFPGWKRKYVPTPIPVAINVVNK